MLNGHTVAFGTRPTVEKTHKNCCIFPIKKVYSPLYKMFILRKIFLYFSKIMGLICFFLIKIRI